jgi:imidazole glycerol-phosphate synthase subunit HisH
MIVILDTGMGNVGSIGNMLKKIGVPSLVTQSISEIEHADKIIFPGVGAFDHGMENLMQLGLIPLLEQQVLVKKVPVLGICLGMQLMSQRSEEGNKAGLGWLPAVTKRFCFDSCDAKMRIPHMGWNEVKFTKESPLSKNLMERNRFYFVHSFHLVCDRAEDVLSWTEYGYSYASAVQRENVVGVQFHPEKSHKFGLQFLENFALGF